MKLFRSLKFQPLLSPLYLPRRTITITDHGLNYEQSREKSQLKMYPLPNRNSLLQILSQQRKPTQVMRSEEKIKKKKNYRNFYETLNIQIEDILKETKGISEQSVKSMFAAFDEIYSQDNSEENLKKKIIANVCLSKLIKVYSNMGRIDLSLAFFEKYQTKWMNEVKKSKMIPFPSIIQVLCQNERTLDVQKILDDVMKDQKKIPTSIASQLILYHTKKGNMKESLSYLHNMISPQFKPSIKIFNSVMSVCMSSINNVHHFESTFRLMISLAVKPNSDTLLLMLKLINSSSGIDYVLTDMKTWKVQPNPYIAYKLIKYCIDHKNVDKGAQVFQQFRLKKSLGPESYNELLYGYTTNEQVEAAITLFDEMKKLSVQVSQKVYFSFFDMIQKRVECKAELARYIFNHLQLQLEPISPKLILKVLETFSEKGDVVAIYNLHGQILNRVSIDGNQKNLDFSGKVFERLQPMPLTLMNEFLRAFVKNKKPHIALTLLQDMEKSHLYESKPTEDSFLIIMSSIDQTQQLYFLQQILHEMIRFQVHPTQKSFELLSSIQYSLKYPNSKKIDNQFKNEDFLTSKSPVALLLQEVSSSITLLSNTDVIGQYINIIDSLSTKIDLTNFETHKIMN